MQTDVRFLDESNIPGMRMHASTPGEPIGMPGTASVLLEILGCFGHSADKVGTVDVRNCQPFKTRPTGDMGQSEVPCFTKIGRIQSPLIGWHRSVDETAHDPQIGKESLPGTTKELDRSFIRPDQAIF